VFVLKAVDLMKILKYSACLAFLFSGGTHFYYGAVFCVPKNTFQRQNFHEQEGTVGPKPNSTVH